MATYKGPASESQRVAHLQKRRERHAEEMEIKKKRLAEELKLDKMESKFASISKSDSNGNNTAAGEQRLGAGVQSSGSVHEEVAGGLLTVSQMKDRQMEATLAREKQLAQDKYSNGGCGISKFDRMGGGIYDNDDHVAEKEEERREKIKKLTFAFQDDSESDHDEDTSANTHWSQISKPSPVESRDANDECSIKKKNRLGMNPDVNTSFLPDIDRDAEEQRLREQLRQQWQDRQQNLKNEPIDVVFSYWDGSGHRRSITLKKGQTIYHFLQKALECLRPDFHDLRAVTGDQLMYVKEDLIIPQTSTFYDFIVTKARGKSGPLFNFDVHDDVRIVNDASVEKNDSHAGKVVLRSWYERNKHIFPASRWEPYDPAKNYSNYTISDNNNA